MVLNNDKKQFLFFLNRKRIIVLGFILGISSVLSIFYVDQPLSHWFHESINGRLDPVAKVFTTLGAGDIYFFISVVGYLIARLFSYSLTHLTWAQRLAETRHRFGFMFLCFLISGILVLVLKAIFGRARPYVNPDFYPIQFQPFTLDWNYQSYPSGHTQVGFTLATFLAILYPKWSWAFFLFAICVGLSRIILKNHYLGDVFAGAYIGILGTFLAWQWKGQMLKLNMRSE